MTTATTIGDFNIGRVIGRTVNSIGANLINLLILSVVLVAAPTALIAWVQQTFLINQGLAVSGFSTVIGDSLISLALSIVQVALSMAAQGAIFYFVVSSLMSRRASLGDALAKGLQHWLPLFLIAICKWFMIFLGFLALLVPGIILAIRWIVSLPVQVIEDKNVFDSMGRSADLTKGRRWSIFGLVLVVGLIVFVVEMVMIVVIVRPGGSLLRAFSLPMTRLLIAPILAVITTPVYATGYACLYYELRSTREGVGVEALASVFD